MELHIVSLLRNYWRYVWLELYCSFIRSCLNLIQNKFEWPKKPLGVTLYIDYQFDKWIFSVTLRVQNNKGMNRYPTNLTDNQW
jgi:hypothetical protein